MGYGDILPLRIIVLGQDCAPLLLLACVLFYQCDGGSPSEPAPKWLEVHDVRPESTPFRLHSVVTVFGENLDGVRRAHIISSEGMQEAGIGEKFSDSLRIGVRPHEGRGKARLILSEGTAPYHQSDTLPGYLHLIGPDPADSLVYEYRDEGGGFYRWEEQSFPLKIYLAPFVDPGDRDTAIVGITEWADVIRPGLPSFVFVSDSTDADILFTAGLSAGRSSLCVAQFFSEKDQGELRMIYLSAIRCKMRLFDGRMTGRKRDIWFIAAHEIGHALGISGHSDIRGSIMFYQAAVIDLSQSDVRTLRHLYARDP